MPAILIRSMMPIYISEQAFNSAINELSILGYGISVMTISCLLEGFLHLTAQLIDIQRFTLGRFSS